MASMKASPSCRLIKTIHPPSTARLTTSHSSIRPYHSIYHPRPAPFPPVQARILSHALEQVPRHGFTSTALTTGAKSAGYLEISTQLFPRGPYDLINYYLVTQRLSLQDRVQFPESSSSTTTNGAPLSLTDKIRALCWARLQANAETGILPHWQQALGQMSLLGNIPPSLLELGNLADEIWYLAGDTTVDFSWYTRRASLAAVYASTELFMTTDTSKGFEQTRAFLDRRLVDTRVVGGTIGGPSQFTGFWARSGLGLARAWGLKV